MNVSLVSVTTPDASLQTLGIKTAEDLVAFTARVSNPGNQMSTETAPRLLKYLAKHKHWSPFEMVSMTLQIDTSRAIAAQMLRHRSFSFQEFSQRYAVADMGYEEYRARRQDLKNKQNSIDDLPPETIEAFREAQAEVWKLTVDRYLKMLKLGVAKEQARMLLPLATTTRLYMSGSLRSWIHYLESRTAVETQLEHREPAEAIKAIFIGQFPATSEALWGLPPQAEHTVY